MSGSADAGARLVQGLLDHGVRDVVLSPGSRSAPLAYALARLEGEGRVRLHVRHDERSAAFVALGCALADPRRPAVVVTTSGTAVANLLPATAEAHHAAVPLLLLTADRPAALRGTWANQTSALQPAMLGAAPVLTEVVEATGDVDWHALAGRVVHASLGFGPTGRPAGPVHLDVGFDEPLVPDAGAATPAPRAVDLPAPAAAPRPTVLDLGPRTLVVAGAGAGPAARELAERAGWPLLAEPSSGAKGGPHRVGAHRLVLGAPRLVDAVDRVVVLGRPTLSRPVTRLLARPDVAVVQVVRHPDEPGPGRPVERHVGPVVPGPGSRDERWLDAWTAAGRAAEQAVDDVLDDDGRTSGPWLARQVARASGRADVLVTASSNPVRDLDLVAPPAEGTVVLANRGLAGIDGTLSSAVGAAVVAGRPTRVLVGDLAALHDLGGLVVPAAERDRLRLQVVLLDDDGGGIFGLLEHADRPEVFERVFGMPHGADLVAAAAALGVPARRAVRRDDIVGAIRVVPQGISLVAVTADRAWLAPLHARLREVTSAAVAGAAN